MNEKVKKILKNQGGNYIFPFFWQHGESEAVLREYMQVIDESNIKAVCVESRPHPEFCGDRWWQDMDVILEEAKQRGMKVWILDDSHFPTGYANGAMAEQPDELCRQVICCRTYCIKGKKKICIEEEELCHPDAFEKNMFEQHIMEQTPRTFEDDSILAVYAVRMNEEKEGFLKKNGFLDKNKRINLSGMVENNTLEWTVPEGEWKIYVLHRCRNRGYHRSYINMLDEASCKVLLDAVYEPHYERYGQEFGTTIAGFFSDEPELGNGHMYDMDDGFGKAVDYPWSRDTERLLKSRLGEEYGMYLALLWETEADETLTAKVRYTYMDIVTELVKKNFSEQVGAWCRAHGVRYIGHLIEDNNHHTRTGASLGHYFRGLAGQDMAGIDDIGGQVFPQGEEISYNDSIFHHRDGEFYHYMLGKLGSSAAAIEPLKKGNSMCEIYGNYGWAEGVRLEKYLTDHFLVRGINHYVPHAFSPKEFPDPDCPPHFYAHGHNPQYRHFGRLMGYTNRVCELITGGRHVAPAAVLYHAEGDWTGRHMTADKIGHVLADAQIEYDYIPQDVLAKRSEYHTVIEEKLLKVNTQNYRVVIVPYMQFVTETFAKAVTEMAEKGITVVFAGDYPEGICDTDHALYDSDRKSLSAMHRDGTVVSTNALVDFLKRQQIPEFELIPADDRIRYLHYLHEDGTELYMFVNEGIDVYRGTIHFQPERTSTLDRKSLYLYDAWENVIEAAMFDNGIMTLEIEPLKSCIYIFDASKDVEYMYERERCWDKREKKEVEFAGGWRRSICKSTAYPVFTKPKEILLPDNLAEEEPDFSGFVRYENEFVAEQGACIYLEITDAYEGVEVFLNDISMGIQIVPVYRFDLSGALADGENRLRIEVATTLERELAGIPDQMGQIKEAEALSGITSEVSLWEI